jgi:hypothetical protein
MILRKFVNISDLFLYFLIPQAAHLIITHMEQQTIPYAETKPFKFITEERIRIGAIGAELNIHVPVLSQLIYKHLLVCCTINFMYSLVIFEHYSSKVEYMYT